MFHLGRQDFQVKIRGYRIDVSEIENALRTTTGIRDAVVVGRELGQGEQRLVAYYVPSVQPPVSAGVLRQALAQALPAYMIPSAYVAIDALPQTPNGKTDRLRLPPPQWNRRTSDAPLTPPRTPIEAELAALWAAVLGLDQVGIHDTILELGGDSLQAAIIAARVTARFGLDLTVSELLKSGSVAEIAAEAAASLRDEGMRRDRPTAAGDRSVL
jgi:acyl carrier protein